VIPPDVRIFVCTEPIDMRWGFDRLAHVAKSKLGADPQGGALFVFAGRGATRLKVLWFERHGYCMLYKRLHRAVFTLPHASNGSMSVHINARELAKLLAGTPKTRKSIRRARENLDMEKPDAT
jgi:transposase